MLTYYNSYGQERWILSNYSLHDRAEGGNQPACNSLVGNGLASGNA